MSYSLQEEEFIQNLPIEHQQNMDQMRKSAIV